MHPYTRYQSSIGNMSGVLAHKCYPGLHQLRQITETTSVDGFLIILAAKSGEATRQISQGVNKVVVINTENGNKICEYNCVDQPRSSGIDQCRVYYLPDKRAETSHSAKRSAINNNIIIMEESTLDKSMDSRAALSQSDCYCLMPCVNVRCLYPTNKLLGVIPETTLSGIDIYRLGNNSAIMVKAQRKFHKSFASVFGSRCKNHYVTNYFIIDFTKKAPIKPGGKRADYSMPEVILAENIGPNIKCMCGADSGIIVFNGSSLGEADNSQNSRAGSFQSRYFGSIDSKETGALASFGGTSSARDDYCQYFNWRNCIKCGGGNYLAWIGSPGADIAEFIRNPQGNSSEAQDDSYEILLRKFYRG